MPLSVLAICNHVLQTCGNESLTSGVSTSRIGALLQNAAAHVRTLPLTWPRVSTSEGMSGGPETFTLPDDFYRYVPGTAYVGGNVRDVTWPTPDDVWAMVEAGNITIGETLLVRQRANTLQILNGTSGQSLFYDYFSSAMFTDSAGTTKKVRFTADTDLWAFDDDLAILELLWRYKQATGAEDWQLAQAEAVRYQQSRIAAENGPSILSTNVMPSDANYLVHPYASQWG